MATSETTSPAVDLTPFVPRVVVEWLREAPGGSPPRARGHARVRRHLRLHGDVRAARAAGASVGAEEMTDVDEPHVRAVCSTWPTPTGGGLLKFGGDALLLFSRAGPRRSAPATPPTACGRALRELGPAATTSAGPVTLRMHVGIHSGAFDFFLVGESHRELIVTGPARHAHRPDGGGRRGGRDRSSAKRRPRRWPRRSSARRRQGGRLLEPPPAVSGELAPLPPFEDVDVAPMRAAAGSRASRGEGTASRSTARRPSASSTSAASTRCSPTPGRGGGGGSRGARRGSAATAERARRHLPRDRHRRRRRQADPRRRRAADRGRGRGAAAAHAARDRSTGRAGCRCAWASSRGRVFAGEVGAPFRRPTPFWARPPLSPHG